MANLWVGTALPIIVLAGGVVTTLLISGDANTLAAAAEVVLG